MALKADHFLTPIKLILPGIIVSLVGASTAYFVFNNPEKNKAKQTYASWNVIREYEAAYDKSSEEAICLSDPFDQIQFQKDLTHHLGVLIDNLEDLKDEANIDMRLKAFLNLKMARYSDTKKITEAFLDSVIKLNRAFELAPDNTAIREEGRNLQIGFSTEKEHIETRDTNELKRIAFALNKDHLEYTDSFLLKIPRLQTTAEIKQNVVGRWHFPEGKAMIEFKKDSTGTWEELGNVYDIKWTMAEKTITIQIETEIHNFILVEATSTKLSAVWKEKGFVLIGCRKDPSAK